MPTFNIDLWKSLQNIYSNQENSYLKNKIFFGLAPEKTNVPYCVIHVLDSGLDENAQTLCKNDEGYNKVGTSSIQFSLYATNDMAIDELLQELNDNIYSLSNLNEYRIIRATRQETKNASSFSNETGMGLTRFLFEYEGL